MLRIAILNRLIREDFSKTALKQRFEEQNLVSPEFKDIVQNGIRWFCWYAFENNCDFTIYKDYEVQNPMFTLMRFLVHPSAKNLILLSRRENGRNNSS